MAAGYKLSEAERVELALDLIGIFTAPPPSRPSLDSHSTGTCIPLRPTTTTPRISTGGVPPPEPEGSTTGHSVPSGTVAERPSKRRRKDKAPSLPLRLAMVLLRLARYHPDVWKSVGTGVLSRLRLLARHGKGPNGRGVHAEVREYLTELSQVHIRHPEHDTAPAVRADLETLLAAVAEELPVVAPAVAVGAAARMDLGDPSFSTPASLRASTTPITPAAAIATGGPAPAEAVGHGNEASSVPPPPGSDGWTVFSEAAAWSDSTGCYAETGEALFQDHTVPSAISNGRAHAANVATVVAGFVADLGLGPSARVTIVDVGSGTGRFGYHLARTLEGVDLNGVDVTVILADLFTPVQRSTVLETGWRPLVEAGRVDWVTISPLAEDAPTAITLWSQTSLGNLLRSSDAVVFTANYLVDSCPTDLFYQHREGVCPILCRPHPAAEKGIQFAAASNAFIDPDTLHALTTRPSESVEVARALEGLTKVTSVGTSFAVPTGFLKIVAALSGLVEHGVPGIWVVSDKTCAPWDYQDPTTPPPGLDRHGERCVSLAINPQHLGVALASAFPQQPSVDDSARAHASVCFLPESFVLAKQACNVFQTAVYPFIAGELTSLVPPCFPRLAEAFEAELGTFATSDWEALSSLIDERDSRERGEPNPGAELAIDMTQRGGPSGGSGKETEMGDAGDWCLASVPVAIGVLRLSGLDLDELQASQPGLAQALDSGHPRVPELLRLCRLAVGVRFGPLAVHPALLDRISIEG